MDGAAPAPSSLPPPAAASTCFSPPTPVSEEALAASGGYTDVYNMWLNACLGGSKPGTPALGAAQAPSHPPALPQPPLPSRPATPVVAAAAAPLAMQSPARPPAPSPFPSVSQPSPALLPSPFLQAQATAEQPPPPPPAQATLAAAAAPEEPAVTLPRHEDGLASRLHASAAGRCSVPEAGLQAPVLSPPPRHSPPHTQPMSPPVAERAPMPPPVAVGAPELHPPADGRRTAALQSPPVFRAAEVSVTPAPAATAAAHAPVPPPPVSSAAVVLEAEAELAAEAPAPPAAERPSLPLPGPSPCSLPSLPAYVPSPAAQPVYTMPPAAACTPTVSAAPPTPGTHPVSVMPVACVPIPATLEQPVATAEPPLGAAAARYTAADEPPPPPAPGAAPRAEATPLLNPSVPAAALTSPAPLAASAAAASAAATAAGLLPPAPLPAATPGDLVRAAAPVPSTLPSGPPPAQVSAPPAFPPPTVQQLAPPVAADLPVAAPVVEPVAEAPAATAAAAVVSPAELPSAAAAAEMSAKAMHDAHLAAVLGTPLNAPGIPPPPPPPQRTADLLPPAAPQTAAFSEAAESTETAVPGTTTTTPLLPPRAPPAAVADPSARAALPSPAPAQPPPQPQPQPQQQPSPSHPPAPDAAVPLRPPTAPWVVSPVISSPPVPPPATSSSDEGVAATAVVLPPAFVPAPLPPPAVPAAAAAAAVTASLPRSGSVAGPPLPPPAQHGLPPAPGDGRAASLQSPHLGSLPRASQPQPPQAEPTAARRWPAAPSAENEAAASLAQRLPPPPQSPAADLPLSPRFLQQAASSGAAAAAAAAPAPAPAPTLPGPLPHSHLPQYPPLPSALPPPGRISFEDRLTEAVALDDFAVRRQLVLDDASFKLDASSPHRSAAAAAAAAGLLGTAAETQADRHLQLLREQQLHEGGHRAAALSALGVVSSYSPEAKSPSICALARAGSQSAAMLDLHVPAPMTEAAVMPQLPGMAAPAAGGEQAAFHEAESQRLASLHLLRGASSDAAAVAAVLHAERATLAQAVHAAVPAPLVTSQGIQVNLRHGVSASPYREPSCAAPPLPAAPPSPMQRHAAAAELRTAALVAGKPRGKSPGSHGRQQARVVHRGVSPRGSTTTPRGSSAAAGLRGGPSPRAAAAAATGGQVAYGHSTRTLGDRMHTQPVLEVRSDVSLSPPPHPRVRAPLPTACTQGAAATKPAAPSFRPRKHVPISFADVEAEAKQTLQVKKPHVPRLSKQAKERMAQGREEPQRSTSLRAGVRGTAKGEGQVNTKARTFLIAPDSKASDALTSSSAAKKKGSKVVSKMIETVYCTAGPVEDGSERLRRLQ